MSLKPLLFRALSRVPARVALVLALLRWISPVPAEPMPEFFVATSGSDSNPGTRDRPVATLERARDLLRSSGATRGSPPGPAVIHLGPGDHARTSPLELTADDSGLPGSPVVWRAEPGTQARLLGGRRLGGFKPVTDPEVLRRLPVAARAHVQECDLRALDIREFGEMKSRGFGRPTAVAHCELFHGGQPMTLARWPNAGAFTSIAGFPDTSGHNDDHGGNIGRLEDGFLFEGDRPRNWKPSTNLWVHGYWAWDWANSYERVVSLDPETRRIRTAPPYGLYGFRKGQRFFFLNILEELDEPGEWFLDPGLAKLFFWPPEVLGTEPESLLSLLDGPLIRMTGASNVIIAGVILEATRGNGVEIRQGSSNLIAGCVLRNIGNTGVLIESGIGHGVSGCDLQDEGDSGVSLSGGDRQTLTPGGHFVENCHFRRQGRWSRCYSPAIHLVGVGLRASHNLIEDHPHCAILFWGNDHRIDFNEIHHVALETGDVGAIYTGRNFTFRGNRIRNNFIHDTGGVGMGSMGVYMDDCVSGTEISGNVFHRVQRAVFLGGGRDHRVYENVFVDCNPAVQLDGRGLDRSPVWRDMVDKTMRAGLAEVPAELYRRRYPELKSLDADYGPPGGPALTGESFRGVPPTGNRVKGNLAVGKWLEIGWNATPSDLVAQDNILIENPGFVRAPGTPARATDFALRDDAPALQAGFPRLPLGQIGLQEDAWRRQLPGRSNAP
ncbi:MAG: right-handed parallel beta-helix repeat-containing protein [Verrucomicrobiales bacterium]|nr:right-handed parallel beta-helix repeat-containing protein [Verrucomicrobiales bacterium]